MFVLENVTKSYERREQRVVALDSTSLTIAAGDYVAIVGSSGSGKTTLLSLLGGMLAPTSGTVCLDGKSLYDMPVAQRACLRRDRIGFVFQTFNLVPYLTALENVQVPLTLAGVPSSVQRDRAMELLSRVGLDDRVAHKPRELSVGQQQRVALARMLANDPDVILADEPTGNLDPATRHQVLAFLREFHQEGRTIVLVTHDPIVAQQASRTLTLTNGTLVMDEPALARLSA